MQDYYWWLRVKATTSQSRIMRSLCRRLLTPLSLLCGCFIPLSARVANKPCFPHGLHGIFISSNAVIGRNCVIFQNVTIGSNFLPGSSGMGAPVIGDNCFIGAGANIIGGVKIGSNVRIAANSSVYKDVPDNCVVTSARQENHQRGGLDNRYYSYDGRWKYYEDEKWHYTDDPAITVPLEKARINSGS
jgi:serine O-acetyltransferase